MNNVPFGKKCPTGCACNSPAPLDDDELAMDALRADVSRVVSQFVQATGRKVNAVFLAYEHKTGVGAADARVNAEHWPELRHAFNQIEARHTTAALVDLITQIR